MKLSRRIVLRSIAAVAIWALTSAFFEAAYAKPPAAAPVLVVRFTEDSGMRPEVAVSRVNGSGEHAENALLQAQAGFPSKGRTLARSGTVDSPQTATFAAARSLQGLVILEYPNVRNAESAARMMRGNRQLFAEVFQDYCSDDFSSVPADPSYWFESLNCEYCASPMWRRATSSGAAHSLLGRIAA
jgi:hypothetical protein